MLGKAEEGRTTAARHRLLTPPTASLSLAVLCCACAISGEPPSAASDGLGGSRPALATGGGGGGTGGSASGAVAGAPLTGGVSNTGGSLVSDVFGLSAPEASGGASACDGPVAQCEWSRLDGCCKHLACERANGADVFNLYPVQSCQALLACVRAHPGCSNADDPLCFGAEDPGAPCLNEGYQASHTDPAGPYAWTVELVRCVCGY